MFFGLVLVFFEFVCFLGLCGVLLEFVFVFYISFLFEFWIFWCVFWACVVFFWSLFLFFI